MHFISHDHDGGGECVTAHHWLGPGVLRFKFPPEAIGQPPVG